MRSLALVVALALVASIPASANAEIISATGAFHLRASHGFKLTVFAYSRRANGAGQVYVFAQRRHAAVSYAAPANVTDAHIEAQLGALGKISVDFVPTGAIDEERSRCGNDFIELEEGSYQGEIEFHGEQGYTSASATKVRAEARPFLDLICFGRSEGETIGPGLPGAKLVLSRKGKTRRLSLRLFENRPGARMRYSAELSERRGRMAISRTVEGAQRAGTFRFNTKRGTALLEPLAPFSGRARFQRSASPRARWAGSLAIDFPGRADVPLTGPGTKVGLAPARHQFG